MPNKEQVITKIKDPIIYKTMIDLQTEVSLQLISLGRSPEVGIDLFLAGYVRTKYKDKPFDERLKILKDLEEPLMAREMQMLRLYCKLYNDRVLSKFVLIEEEEPESESKFVLEVV